VSTVQVALVEFEMLASGGLRLRFFMRPFDKQASQRLCAGWQIL